MTYGQYVNKVRRQRAFLELLRRKKWQIAAVIAAVLLVAATLLIFKGASLSDISGSESYTYGDPLGFKATAFLGRVSYEYSSDGGESWSAEAPVTPGSYTVRAVSNGGFGKKHLGTIGFVIEKRPLRVELWDTVIEYGSDDEIEVKSAIGLAENDRAVMNGFAEARRNPGSYTLDADSFSVVNQAGEDVSDCYSITVGEAVLTVTPRSIEIIASSAEKEYDGSPLISGGSAVSGGGLVYGDRLDCTVTGSRTEAGSSENRVTGFAITDSDGNDIKDRYSVSFVSGSLTVKKRPITVASESLTAVYDGEVHNTADCKITSGSLVEGHRLEAGVLISVGDDLTLAGTHKNTVSCEISDGVRSVTRNYEISYVFGTVTINPRPITVRTGSAFELYGKGASAMSGEVSLESGSLVEGHFLEIATFATLDIPGKKENNSTVRIRESYSRKNVTSNYDITYEYGTLTMYSTEEELIDAEYGGVRPVNISRMDYELTYDGKTHTFVIRVKRNSGLTDFDNYSSFDIAEGDEVVINYRLNKTEAGQYKIQYESLKVIYGDNNVSYKYNITVSDCTVRINQREIRLSTTGNEKIYDGLPIEVPRNIGVSSGSLVEGHRISADFISKPFFNVGSISNTIHLPSLIISNAAGNDVTRNYIIGRCDFGVLRIYARDLGAFSEKAEKIYDGTPLTEGTVDLSGLNLVLNQTLKSLTVTGSQTNVGSSKNTFEFVVVDAEGNDVTKNYSAENSFGELVVTARKVIITTKSAELEYNGRAQSCNEYEVTDGSFVEGQLAALSRVPELTEVGVSENRAEYVRIFDLDGNDTTANYEITLNYGTLTVKPRALTVKLLDAEKSYDGNPLDIPGYSIVSGSLAEGDKLQINPNAGVTDVGSFEIEAEAKIFSPTSMSYITQNYDLTVLPAKLTVRPAGSGITQKPVVTLTPVSVSKQYDGSPLTATRYIVTGGLSALAKVVDVRCEGSQTEVGESLCRITSCRLVQNGVDVTANYTLVFNPGTLTVTPIRVPTTTGSRIIEYDGKPLTLAGCQWDESVFLPGHTPYIAAAGEQTNVGTAVNEAVLLVLDAGGNDVTRFYRLRPDDFGRLTVAPRLLYVMTGSASKVYDGTPLSSDDFAIKKRRRWTDTVLNLSETVSPRSVLLKTIRCRRIYLPPTAAI